MRRLKFHTVLRHSWYKSEIIIGGWATCSFYGPLHRHRAEKVVDKCKLEVARILAREALQGAKIHKLYH